MRHLLVPTALAACLLPASVRADSQSFTLTTGYNETALASPFNRGTALQACISRGAQLYTGSFDNRGLTSFGVGRIAPGQDIDCNINRYPMITFFARPGERSGVAFNLNQDWYWRGHPSREPGKYLTLFQTQAGVVCQDGQLPKVRVTQRFTTSERRFPGRSQGVEWVWEFRQDYPTDFVSLGGRGDMTTVLRRSMRLEHWAFFSREVGVGVLNINVGATHKTVARPVSDADPVANALNTIPRTQPGFSRIPVLMVRVGYTIRRW